MPSMTSEEMIIQSGEHEDEIKNDEGNKPDPKPLSETGWFRNPDGSISPKGETEWDSK
jgi:hypothetical protein